MKCTIPNYLLLIVLAVFSHCQSGSQDQPASGANIDSTQTAAYWVEQLDLKAHPEGGYFKRIYHSKDSIAPECLPARYDGYRYYGTSIYHLLTTDIFSSFHKLHSDEIWHYYRGKPVTIHVLDSTGNYEKLKLGPDITEGQYFQQVVPSGHWFAAEVNADSGFSLVGATVAPGFDYNDFILEHRDSLLQAFPQHDSLIKAFTRKEHTFSNQ